MIKFHEPYKAKNTKKYLNRVVERNSYNDNFFMDACLELLSDFYKTKNLLLTHSGTAALEVSAMLLRYSLSNQIETHSIKIPSYTFSSTANAFIRSGFNVSFVDIDSENMILNSSELDCLEDNENLVIVNYANSTFNYKSSNNIKIIEDAAQSFGVTFKKQPVGTFGRYGCVSFHPTKNLHSGYGGLLIVNNAEEFELAKTIWERGTDRNQVLSGLKNKYEWVSLGSSFQINELSSAVLYSQLEVWDKIQKIRKEIYETYEYNLKKLVEEKHFSTQEINENIVPNYHAFYIQINDRKTFMDYMINNNVQTYIGYENLHSSSYAKSNNLNKILPKTEKYSPRIVRLPFHTNLTTDDVIYVCKVISNYFELH